MKRTIATAIIAIVFVTVFYAGPAYADDGTVYVVRAGDTLIRIAARYGLTATQLATANGLRWNAWVYVGQRLRIPGTASTPSAPAQTTSGGTYTVRPGDTLIGIAARHGVSVSQLAVANGLRANAWVYVGQRLRIPGAASPAAPAPATPSAPSSSGTYIVRAGDTLISIALRHNLTVAQLARANGLSMNAWVYTGQRLKIPGAASSTPPSGTPATPSTPSAPSAGSTYTVRPGDTLIGIATRHGVSVSRLAAANGLYTSSWVYVGQRLQIPGAGTSTPSGTPSTTPPVSAPTSGKWIDVNLSTQTLTAYAGQTAVLRTLVSTGTWRTPTVVGTFNIYVKYTSTRMRGPGYDLPNVPYTMYFYRGYGVHGTYWHNNFGTPMSHGCVNMSTPDAKWLFEWAPVGTSVVTHY
jgi:LysM repeat protein